MKGKISTGNSPVKTIPLHSLGQGRWTMGKTNLWVCKKLLIKHHVVWSVYILSCPQSCTSCKTKVIPFVWENDNIYNCGNYRTVEWTNLNLGRPARNGGGGVHEIFWEGVYSNGVTIRKKYTRTKSYISTTTFSLTVLTFCHISC